MSTIERKPTNDLHYEMMYVQHLIPLHIFEDFPVRNSSLVLEYLKHGLEYCNEQSHCQHSFVRG